MRARPTTASESTCSACATSCAHSQLRFALAERPRAALQRIERALREHGFEIHRCIDLPRLAEDRLRERAVELEVLYLTHPLLVLQNVLAGPDPRLFLPALLLVRPHDTGSLACVAAPWSALVDVASEPLSYCLALQAKERLVEALAPLLDAEWPER